MMATNISINQQCGVSINIETLQAITVETLQAIKQCVLGAVAKLSIINGQWSIWRVYRHQLRLARALARAIDAHPTLSNIALWLMGIGIMVEVFLFV